LQDFDYSIPRIGTHFGKSDSPDFEFLDPAIFAFAGHGRAEPADCVNARVERCFENAVASRMPHIEQTMMDNYVAAHTFHFISPVKTDRSGIPSPCTSCYADKTTAWAIAELKKWQNISPWRVGN